MYRTLSASGLVYILLAGYATAHEHHGEDFREGQVITAEPIVSGGFETPWVAPSMDTDR